MKQMVRFLSGSGAGMSQPLIREHPQISVAGWCSGTKGESVVIFRYAQDGIVITARLHLPCFQPVLFSACARSPAQTTTPALSASPVSDLRLAFLQSAIAMAEKYGMIRLVLRAVTIAKPEFYAGVAAGPVLQPELLHKTNGTSLVLAYHRKHSALPLNDLFARLV
jgi:hypothetical protein